MGGIHFEDVVGRGEDHLFAFGEDHGLEDVYGLCDVGHADFVAVIVEYVQCQCGDEGIPDGILLVEELSLGVGHGMVPCTPFANAEFDAVSRVVLFHNLPVLVHYFFDMQTLGKEAVKLVGGVFGCGSVFFCECVVVHVEGLDAAYAVSSLCASSGDFLEELPCPGVIVVARSAGDSVEAFLRGEVTVLGEQPVELCVL